MKRSLLLSLLILFAASCGGPSTDDFDGDGSVDSVDCAPDDPSIHSGAAEHCSDGIDNDCDGWIDCADGDCLALAECEAGDDDDTVGDDDDSAGDDDETVGDDDDSAGDDDDDSAGNGPGECSSLYFNSATATLPIATGGLSLPLTFELWTKPTAFPSPGVAALIGAQDYSFFIEFRSDSAGCSAPGVPVVYSNGNALCGPELPLDTWSHLAVTFDTSGTARFWTDGVLIQSESTGYGGTGTGSQLFLGAENGNGNYYSGYIGPIRISSIERYTGTFTPEPTLQTDNDTLGLWLLSDGVGTITSDSSGNGQDGTIAGATWSSTCPGDDADSDGVPAWQDCDDSDATTYPQAGDVYGDGNDSDCDGLDCEAAYLGVDYFAVCGPATTAATAVSSCAAGGYDGLATVLDSTEDNFLLGLMDSIATAHSMSWPTDQYWLGLNDSLDEGIFLWPSGASTIYTNWQSTTFNAADRDCVGAFEPGHPSEGTWFIADCDLPGEPRSWACELRGDDDGDGVSSVIDCDDSDPQAWESTSSLSFDGVDDYLELASTENAFSITDEFTLSAWIRRAGTGSGRSTVLDIERFGSNSTLSDNVGIELLVDDNGYLAMGFGDGASWHTGAQDYYVSTAALVPDQVWTHVAVTRSGILISFYLDGSLADQVSCHWGTVDFSAGSSREDDLTRVGMSYQLTFSGTENNVRFFDGDISQVGIWNRELTAQEVSTLLGPLPAAGNTLTNLQGYWSLEATSFVDATGYHGTASINGPELSTSCFP